MSRQPFIPVAVPALVGKEWEYLKECLDTNWVSTAGPFVEKFELQFADTVGADYAVACVSGTAALHIAMRLAGVEAGDEVFVSTFTFVGSLNPILYEKGVPVLVDAELRTWNLDPDLLVEEIECRVRQGRTLPRAVEVVHVFGHPADMATIADVCRRYNIFLIEDAAEALGARYVSGVQAGKWVGTVGNVGCFSFNGNKVITAGGGGMLVTDDAALATRARHLTTQARRPGLEYRHDEIAYNYRLTNIAAALGVAQLEQLSDFLLKKKDNAARYDEALGDVPGITLPPREAFADPSMWLYSVLLDEAVCRSSRDEVMTYLKARGVEARPLWTPAHLMELYCQLPRLRGCVSEEIFRRGLSLPSSVSLTPGELDRVVCTFRACIRRDV